MMSATRADRGLPVRGHRHDGQPLNPAELGRLVRATAAAADNWREIVRFTESSRWFQRLALTTDYEIWLLSQRTGFHDHGHASGAFAIARGELLETLAAPGTTRLRHRVAQPGSVTTFGAHHLHDVGSNSSEPAISVHAYSPPLSAMRCYEMTSAGLKLVGTERAERDW